MTKEQKKIVGRCVRCELEKKPSEFTPPGLDEDMAGTCRDCAITRLTVEGIKDFQVCSLFYDYRHQRGEIEAINNRELMAQRFRNVLLRIVTFYFYKKQSGLTPSYNAILNKWERYWFPKEMDAYDIAVEQHTVSHGNLTQYSNIAAVGLLKMYEDFDDKTIEPLLISEPFSVPLASDIVLEGTFDLVFRHAGHHTVVKFSTSKRRPTEANLQMDMAALRIAWEYRNGPSKPARYYLYDLASARPGLLNMDPDDEVVDNLKFWARMIRDSDIFFPRRGLTTYCKGCPFDAQCSKWAPALKETI